MAVTINGSAGVTTNSGAVYNGISSGTVNAGGTNPFPSTGGPAIVDFTNIPSWVKRITVMFSGMSTSGTSIQLIQLGVSGTPQTTGYAGSYGDYASALGTSAISQSGFPFNAGALASYSSNGQLTLCLLGSNIWTISSTISSNPGRQGICYGAVTLTGTLNLLRVTTVNGTDTFDAGSINILYE